MNSWCNLILVLCICAPNLNPVSPARTELRAVQINQMDVLKVLYNQATQLKTDCYVL